MTEFERFALALALTESDDRELAWGDAKSREGLTYIGVGSGARRVEGAEFMAMGRWQMHPVWYAEWADPAIQVGWSWDTAFRAALRRFFDEYGRQDKPIWERAQIFHLGASAFARGEVDRDYALRFARFWDAQSSENEV